MKRQQGNQFWRWLAPGAGLMWLLAAGPGFAAEDNMPELEDLKIPLWDWSGAVRGAAGYKDNVLLGHTDAPGSAFWMSAAEVMAFRLPSHGWQFSLFAEASDTRYFDSPAVDNEQNALAVARLSKDFGPGWESALGLAYMFQNQVYDNSADYADATGVGQIIGHALTPRWSLRKTLGAWWVEGEVAVTRQWLEAPLDDYRQYRPQLSVGHRWENDTELTWSCQYARLDYDHREQLDQQGLPLAGSALALNAPATELALSRGWGKNRCWLTRLGVVYEASRDNGPGFFDYDKYRLSGSVRYRDERWEVTARAWLGHYDYLAQTVSVTDPARRRRTSINLSLRAEYKCTRHLLAHASYVWDRSLSNLDFDDYEAGTVMGGLALAF